MRIIKFGRAGRFFDVLVKIGLIYSLGLAAPSAYAFSSVQTISGEIRRGETASSLLGGYMPRSAIHDVAQKSKSIFPLTRLREGQPYKIRILDKDLIAFEYEIDDDERLLIKKDEEDYRVARLPIPYDTRDEVISVEIDSSLAKAVEEAKVGQSLAYKLADIFAWDIDFIRDIRPGDSFELLLEQQYRGGSFMGYGDLKAAFFTNQGHTYKAFLHEDAQGIEGYFDENGKSLEKIFLKAPLNYRKISSYFSGARFHPILKRFLAHPGVDYAAPKNTPIKSVADGVITSIYYSKTSGRQITISHANGYETSYFHMNKYARGMKKGRAVSQGDVIGYVGKTGLATGYHLCLRMRKNGKPVNPLNSPSGRGKPVDDSEMNGFRLLAGKYTETLMAHQKLARSEGR